MITKEWWKIFRSEYTNGAWSYYQQIRIGRHGYFELDDWCIDNIGPEGIRWRRKFMSIWEFMFEEDLVAFRLAWMYD